MFIEKTKQGHIIHEIWTTADNNYFVISENPLKENNKYEWGAYYNIDKGYWGYGHYDYKDLATARLCMFSLYENEITDIIYKNFDSKMSKRQNKLIIRMIIL